jgi:Uma2 family endonuclease
MAFPWDKLVEYNKPSSPVQGVGSMTTANVLEPKASETPSVNGAPFSPPYRQIPEEQRFVIDDVSYASYVQISDALPNRHIRITYTNGRLELMSTSREHERYDSLLGRLISVLTEELNIDIECGGRMTLRQEEAEKGIEPDDCYWIEHEPQMRGKDTYDPAVDPPPDLAWEIEVSRSILDRLEILAALKVPEVWRYDGVTIIILLLNAAGQYEVNQRSKAFPFLPVKELVRFLNMRTTMSQTQIARAFRSWVREQVAAGWPSNASFESS